MLSAIWWMRDFKENTFLLFIAAGYIWISGLGIAHILTSDGMDLFIVGSTNLAIQFAIGARLLEALLLLAAPVAAAKKFDGHLLLTAFAIIAISVAALVFSDTPPTTYIENSGLTGFTIFSEFLVIVLLGAAIFSMWRPNRSINLKEKVLVSTAIIFAICGELSFTFYVEIFDISVLLGHIFKTFSIWLIFQAIITYNLKAPLRELGEFRNALDSVVDGVTIFDAETLEISYVNEIVANRVGKGVTSIIGQTPDFIRPNFDPSKFRKLSEPLADGTKKSLTYTSTHVDEPGIICSREITLQLLDAGQENPRFIAISRDLDARIRMKQAQAELEFQKLALDEHAIVSMTNAKGEITYANDKLCEISGYSREELLGNSHNILSSGEHSDAFYKEIWETISVGRPWHGEIKNKMKDGGEYWLQSTILPHVTNDGKSFSYIGIRSDITKRKEAASDAQKFKRALDVMDDGVIMCWADTLTLEYLNDTAVRWMEGDRSSLYGRDMAELSPEIDKTNFEKQARLILTGENSLVEYETQILGVDGLVYWVAVILQIVESEHERDRILINARDITERKLAENEILKFMRTISLSDDGVIISWADSLKIDYVNEKSIHWFGLSREAFLGMTLPELNPNFDKSQFDTIKNKLLANEISSSTYETALITADGEVIALEVMVQVLRNSGEAPRIVTIARNINDRKKTDHKVRLLQKTLDSIADPVSMFWLDSLEFFYANKANADFSGYSVEEMIGRTPGELFKDFDRNEFDARYEKLLTDELHTMTVEFAFPDQSGKLRSTEVLAQKLFNSNGRAYVVEIFRDISERKKVAQAKSEFISTVSHELRTPLTSIKGVLGLIKAGAFDGAPEKLAPMIDIAYDNSGRLEVLINDILDVEKIAAGRMEYELKPLDASLLIKNAVAANKSYGDKHEVAFVLNASEEHLTINGDNDRLMQVMANLMSNAAKFSPAGSEVEISTIRQNDGVCICVKDYGSGIPEAAQPTIFDRFTQADSSDQREKGGTGLGLSISKTIVEGHGGTIWFTSKLGEGTTFCIKFPIITRSTQGEK